MGTKWWGLVGKLEAFDAHADFGIFSFSFSSFFPLFSKVELLRQLFLAKDSGAVIKRNLMASEGDGIVCRYRQRWGESEPAQ